MLCLYCLFYYIFVVVVVVGIVDSIIKEPLGGAHRDMLAMASNLKLALITQLKSLQQLSITKLLQQRYNKLVNYR